MNTIVLYIRMIVVMLITLYTSRILLEALGIDDFGLYNVVGGVVGLLVFFNRTVEKSTQRFLNVSMVEGESQLSSIFSSSITIHLLFTIAFLSFGETVGLWFLNAKVVIPEGRELAANIVYQTSLLSVCASFITIPYSATVIAYEKMTFLAVVSIIDAILKLGIVFLLLTSEGDRLALYGVLLLFIHIVNFILYFVYVRKKNRELKFHIAYNKENFKQIFNFVSWTILGQAAVVGCNQGNVVLVNMFHSLVANAAMSVGNQVNTAIANLTTNFQTAFNPQITKSYAEGNYKYLKSLVYTTSKISYCIMFVVALPVAFNIDLVLDLWLDKVPEYSNTFAILFMVNGILNAISMPFNFTVLSSGYIRNFQIATTIVFLSDLPITYVLFSLGMSAPTVLWVKIFVMILILFVRVFYASRIVNTIRIGSVCFEILLPIIITSFVTVSLAYLLKDFATSVLLCFAYTFIIVVLSVVMIWLVCLKKNERTSLVKIIKRRSSR